MSEKVKVPKEVASALDDLLLLNTDNDVMKIYFDAINVNEARQIPKSALVIRNLEPMQLAVILLNGYEVEQTPEEKLLGIYNLTWHAYNRITDFQKRPGGEFENGFAKGIEKAIEILGIKIKGIND